jgi:hypothetical protein
MKFSVIIACDLGIELGCVMPELEYKIIPRITSKRELLHVSHQHAPMEPGLAAFCVARGCIQNIPDRCRHLYSSCDSAKHQYQQDKLWIPGSAATSAATAWKLRRRRPELWREKTWLLHHNNAPSHTSVLTQQVLVKNKMAVILHPPYTPDLRHQSLQ